MEEGPKEEDAVAREAERIHDGGSSSQLLEDAFFAVVRRAIQPLVKQLASLEGEFQGLRAALEHHAVPFAVGVAAAGGTSNGTTTVLATALSDAAAAAPRPHADVRTAGSTRGVAAAAASVPASGSRSSESTIAPPSQVGAPPGGSAMEPVATARGAVSRAGGAMPPPRTERMPSAAGASSVTTDFGPLDDEDRRVLSDSDRPVLDCGMFQGSQPLEQQDLLQQGFLTKSPSPPMAVVVPSPPAASPAGAGRSVVAPSSGTSQTSFQAAGVAVAVAPVTATAAAAASSAPQVAVAVAGDDVAAARVASTTSPLRTHGSPVVAVRAVPSGDLRPFESPASATRVIAAAPNLKFTVLPVEDSGAEAERQAARGGWVEHRPASDQLRPASVKRESRGFLASASMEAPLEALPVRVVPADPRIVRHSAPQAPPMPSRLQRGEETATVTLGAATSAPLPASVNAAAPSAPLISPLSWNPPPRTADQATPVTPLVPSRHVGITSGVQVASSRGCLTPRGSMGGSPMAPLAFYSGASQVITALNAAGVSPSPRNRHVARMMLSPGVSASPAQSGVPPMLRGLSPPSPNPPTPLGSRPQQQTVLQWQPVQEDSPVDDGDHRQAELLVSPLPLHQTGDASVQPPVVPLSEVDQQAEQPVVSSSVPAMERCSSARRATPSAAREQRVEGYASRE